MSNRLSGNTLPTQPEHTVGFVDLVRVVASIPEGICTVDKWEDFISSGTTQVLGNYIHQQAVFDASLGYAAIRLDRQNEDRSEHFLAAVVPGDMETDQAFIQLHKRSSMRGPNENETVIIPVRGADLTALPIGYGTTASRDIDYGSGEPISQSFHYGLADSEDNNVGLMATNLKGLIRDLIDAQQKIEAAKIEEILGTPEHLLSAAEVLRNAQYETDDESLALIAEQLVTQSVIQVLKNEGKRIEGAEHAPVWTSDFLACIDDVDDSWGHTYGISFKKRDDGKPDPKDSSPIFIGQNELYHLYLPVDYNGALNSHWGDHAQGCHHGLKLYAKNGDIALITAIALEDLATRITQ